MSYPQNVLELCTDDVQLGEKTGNSGEEIEAEEGGEVDGAAVAMTRLPLVFMQSKSQQLCVQRCLGKW